jgi:8-oxo-dGTP pyrophosphatase MutT (NUDIX family)
MVAGSILPISFNHNKELCFLFGKENPMEDSAKGYSDFGGGLEKGETPFQGALREGSEELTGFLGNKKELRKLIKNNGGVYHVLLGTYHIHMFHLPYDENLPKYYNQNHMFLWNKMDKHLLNNSKLFEKIEIQWFTIKEMKEQTHAFREFYREMVQYFIEHENEIIAFLNKTNNKHNKTRKHIRH